MAFYLPRTLFSEIEAFYEKDVETAGSPGLMEPMSPDLSTLSNAQILALTDWDDAGGYENARRQDLSNWLPVSLVSDPMHELDRVSYYLKSEGKNLQIEDKINLFNLTKMLAVPASKKVTIYRKFRNYDSGGKDYKIALKVLGSLGAGASDSDKKAIFDKEVLPRIEKVYQTVLAGPKYSEIVEKLLKKWWKEENGRLFEPYMILAKASDILEKKRMSDLPEIDIPGVEGTAEHADARFQKINFGRSINIMWNPSSNSDATDLLEALGFSQWVRDHADPSFFSPRDKVLYTLDGLQKAEKAEKARFAEIVAAALDLETDLTEADFNNFNQCALITALLHDAKPFNFRRYIEDPNYVAPPVEQDECSDNQTPPPAPIPQGNSSNYKYNSPLQATGPGNERIYPVQIDNYNPNKLINNCVINRNVKEMFNKGDNKSPHNMVKGVFWVYEGLNNDLREAELSTNSTVHRKKISSLIASEERARPAEISPSEQETDLYFNRGMRLKALKTLDRTKDSSYYFLENTKINFDGTNPSTARNDVKVEMTWKLGSLEGLDSTLAILTRGDIGGAGMEGNQSGVDITIKDLITLPLTKRPSAADGSGQYLTNQYSPNYSRLRLKVAPYGDEDATHQSDCMILDLAIIDHQINRSSATGETTLTISYRGYFEATLNMPFNDALASHRVLKSREERQEKALDNLMVNNCEPELVREALRLEQEVYALESAAPSAGTVLVRLQEMRLIHSYQLDQNKMRSGIFGNLLDGRRMYVKNVNPRLGIHYGIGANKALAEITFDREVDVASGEHVYDGQKATTRRDYGFEAMSKEDVARKSLLKRIDKKFFFLGDLMWTLLDCLYESNGLGTTATAKHRKGLKNLNLRFMMGTIYVPNPKNLGGPPTTINPISIPVDLKFFVQWFNATIVNKGITNYPVGTFIRDLVERLVNDVIYDTCFSLLLPDENPPLLRSRTFVSSDKEWFMKDGRGWFNPKSPFGGGSTNLLFPKSLVSTKIKPKPGEEVLWSQRVTSKNYCVIYQQFPSYKRQLAAEDNGLLRDDEYTPTIYYGAKNKNYNFLSDVSFSKTNSPFLREARYFGSSNGGLSLLSNVYDLDFSFKRRKANTMFYPGCIINFILLDWGPRWVDEPPWTDDWALGPIHHLGIKTATSPLRFQERRLGQSDPHIEGTMSNIMGLGGYFLIKSVEYNLGETPGEFEIKISTKFLGTDAVKPTTRLSKPLEEIEHSPDCAAIYDVVASRYNALARQQEDQLDGVVYLSKPVDNPTGEYQKDRTRVYVTAKGAQDYNQALEDAEAYRKQEMIGLIKGFEAAAKAKGYTVSPAVEGTTVSSIKDLKGVDYFFESSQNQYLDIDGIALDLN